MKNYGIRKVKRDLRSVVTVKDALLVKTPSLALVKKQYGEEKLEAYLKLWIIEFNEVINVKRPLKEFQIDELAFLILSKFYNVTIADVNLIFKNAKTGVYGDFYETLSINKILGWFNEYFDSRCNTAGLIARQKHSNITYVEEKGERSGTKDAQLMREAMINYKI